MRVEYFFHEVSWILIVSPNECRRMIIAVQYKRNSDRLLEMVLLVSGSSWILRKPVDYPNLPFKLHCRCQPYKLHTYHTNYIPTIQTTYLPYKLHTYHTNYIPTIQTTYLPYKLHTYHTNYIPTIQTTYQPYKLHTNHTNYIPAIQTTYLPYKLHTYHTN